MQMNPSFSQNHKNNFTQRRQSSTSYVTAWQIESTIKNMLQFIDVIELSETQRKNLSSVLPHVLRVKKIEQQKECLLKQLKDLGKMSISYQKGTKQTNSTQNQNKQKCVALNHENKLKKTVNKLRDQLQVIDKQISCVKQATKQTNENLQKIRNDKKQYLIAQINSVLSNQINSVTDKISQKQLSLNIASEKSQGNIYQSYVEQHINKSILPQRKSSQCMKSFSDNESVQKLMIRESGGTQNSQNQNGNYIGNFRNQIESIQIQFGEIQCKLLSLRDKKRKITVQNLLQNKIMYTKQTLVCNFNTVSSSKSIHLSKSYVKNQQARNNELYQMKESLKQKQSQPNFLTSLFSIFTSPTELKNKQQSSSHIDPPIIKSATKIQKTSFQQNYQQHFEQSLSEMQDSQAKLRMIEINSQILQLRSHMDIMVNQNILEQIIACIMRVRQINEEMHPLLDQLIQVITIMNDESMLKNQDFSMQLTPFQSPKSFESRKLSLSKFSTQSVRQRLRENQNMNFFISLIDQKFKMRLQVTERLFKSFQQSIKVTIKYLRRRLGEIKSEYGEFVQNDMKNEGKIKATQALKSKTQVLLISSEIETLSMEINSLIENRLLKVSELLEKERENFRNYILEKIVKSRGNYKSYDWGMNLDDCLNECRSVEKQVLQIIISGQNQEQEELSINNQGKQRLNNINLVKQTINSQFFHFYDKLTQRVLNLFKQNDLK